MVKAKKGIEEKKERRNKEFAVLLEETVKRVVKKLFLGKEDPSDLVKKNMWHVLRQYVSNPPLVLKALESAQDAFEDYEASYHELNRELNEK